MNIRTIAGAISAAHGGKPVRMVPEHETHVEYHEQDGPHGPGCRMRLAGLYKEIFVVRSGETVVAAFTAHVAQTPDGIAFNRVSQLAEPISVVTKDASGIRG